MSYNLEETLKNALRNNLVGNYPDRRMMSKADNKSKFLWKTQIVKAAFKTIFDFVAEKAQNEEYFYSENQLSEMLSEAGDYVAFDLNLSFDNLDLTYNYGLNQLKSLIDKKQKEKNANKIEKLFNYIKEQNIVL